MLGAPFWGHWLSRGRSTPLKPDEPLEIIDQVGHADLDGGAGDADGAHGKAHPVLLPREHMLNMGSNFGSPGVGLGDPLGHRAPWLAPLVDMALEHASGEERLVLLGSIGRTGPKDQRNRAVLPSPPPLIAKAIESVRAATHQRFFEVPSWPRSNRKHRSSSKELLGGVGIFEPEFVVGEMNYANQTVITTDAH